MELIIHQNRPQITHIIYLSFFFLSLSMYLILLQERRRLRERYPKQAFQRDEVECKKLLVIYHATTKSKEPCGGICRRYGPPPSPKRRSPHRDSPRSS